MNTDLLREDELWAGGSGQGTLGMFAELLRQRLIEEREKNAMLERDASLARKHCNNNYDAANFERKRAETAEAELAEARTLLSNIRHLARNSDPQSWARDSHDIIVAVNAAIK